MNQEGDYRNEDEYEKQMEKSVRICCGFRIGSATGVRTADGGEGGNAGRVFEIGGGG